MNLNQRRLKELSKLLENYGYQSHMADPDFLCIHAENMPVAAYVLDPDSVEGVLHLDVAGAIARDAALLAMACMKLGATILGEDMFIDEAGDCYFGQEAWDRYEQAVERRNSEEV